MATWYIATTGSDSNAGTSSGAPFLTIGHAIGAASTQDTIAVKTGTYTVTANLAVTQAVLTIQGYGTTPGDNGTPPLITTATNGVHLISTNFATSPVLKLENLSLSNTAGTRAHGLLHLTGSTGGTGSWILNRVTMDGFDMGVANDNGIGWFVQNVVIARCEVKNCTTAGVRANFGTSHSIYGSWIHANAANVSIRTGTVCRSIVSDQTSGAAPAIDFGANGGVGICAITECDVVNNAGDGIGAFSAGAFSAFANIVYGNGGYGLTGNTVNGSCADYNAYGANTSGPVNNIPAGPNDVTLTANPFASGADFSLNATAGGGAACKGTGYPGVFPGGASAGTLDIGAVQSAAAASAGSSPMIYVL